MENFEQCDLLIETNCEDLYLKQQTLRKFEEYLPEHCICAFNTSVLSLDQIASNSRRPDKVKSQETHLLKNMNCRSLECTISLQ